MFNGQLMLQTPAINGFGVRLEFPAWWQDRRSRAGRITTEKIQKFAAQRQAELDTFDKDHGLHLDSLDEVPTATMRLAAEIARLESHWARQARAVEVRNENPNATGTFQEPVSRGQFVDFYRWSILAMDEQELAELRGDLHRRNGLIDESAVLTTTSFVTARAAVRPDLRSKFTEEVLRVAAIEAAADRLAFKRAIDRLPEPPYSGDQLHMLPGIVDDELQQRRADGWLNRTAVLSVDPSSASDDSPWRLVILDHTRATIEAELEGINTTLKASESGRVAIPQPRLAAEPALALVAPVLG
jgi:hypothetical protein